MSATAIISFVFLGLAVLCFLIALISALGALQSRLQSTRITYGVGRQDARRSMRIGLLRAALLILLGFIFLGAYGIARLPGGAVASSPTSTATRSAVTSTAALPATDSTEPTVTPFALPPPPATGTLLPSATPLPIAPTPLPSATATLLPSAVVSSEVGLYLREAPGGVQELELLPTGTVLILLPGRTTLAGIEWQEVSTPSGLEGWVAVEFITYQ